MFFVPPIPRSQRLPVTNCLPPLKRLIVRRQLFVHPLHLVIEVSNFNSLISSIESIDVEALSLSLKRSLAISAAPNAPIIPAISGLTASHPEIVSKLLSTASL